MPVPEDFREAGIDGGQLLGLDEAGLSRLLDVDEETLYQRLSSHIDTLSKTKPPSTPAASLSGPSRVPKLVLKSTPSSGWPGSSASTSCISSPRHSPTSSPRGQQLASSSRQQQAARTSFRKGSVRALAHLKETHMTVWSSFGSTPNLGRSYTFDTSPRNCLSPAKERLGPGPAAQGTTLTRSKLSPRGALLGLGEERQTPWLFSRSQASPGPKYFSVRQTTNTGKARSFDKTPRGGCSSSVKADLPPRHEQERPGPGKYNPQYQLLSTFK